MAPDVYDFMDDPTTTPLAAAFPDATHAIGRSYSPTDSVWKYYRLDGTDLYFLGESEIEYICTEPLLHAAFPVSLGDEWTDDATCSFGEFDPVTVSNTLELVATGSIDFPGGTVADVAMMRHERFGESEYYWYTLDNLLEPLGRYSPVGDQITIFPLMSGTGIGAHGAADRMRVWPLPAADAVFIELPDVGVRSLHLIENSGRSHAIVPKRVSQTVLQFDVSSFAAGSYILQIRSDAGLHTSRLTVVH